MRKGRYILVVCVALLLETFVFNFWNVVSLIRDDSYKVDIKEELISNDGYDGTNVQWLIYVGDSKRINYVVMETSEDCTPDFYYTDSNGIIQKLQFKKQGKGYIVKVNKNISGYIGISTYNDSLIDKVVVNDGKITFSFARFIAMILIYIAGSFLFSIQKMPDYKIA